MQAFNEVATELDLRGSDDQVCALPVPECHHHDDDEDGHHDDKEEAHEYEDVDGHKESGEYSGFRHPCFFLTLSILTCDVISCAQVVVKEVGALVGVCQCSKSARS